VTVLQAVTITSISIGYSEILQHGKFLSPLLASLTHLLLLAPLTLFPTYREPTLERLFFLRMHSISLIFPV